MVLLCAVNSSFSHSNPALLVFEKLLDRENIKTGILNCTINEPYGDILARVFLQKADVICFSCYIWNIDIILRLCRELYELIPHVKIILGGPEVSWEPPEVSDCPNVVSVIRGEGEELLSEVVKRVLKGEKQPLTTELGEISDLNTLPFAYDNEENYKNKILYYETSRGCPYHCSYCLSSLTSKVRFLDTARVKREVLALRGKGVKIVKFLDRTFNCDPGRAKELFVFLSKIESLSFHFEIRADLLDEETLVLLSEVPPGRFQFEIGIQSTNPESLSAIGRFDDLDASLSNLERLKRETSIRLHADLIAGLPFDTKKTLLEAVDRLYEICDELQLGFLKLLKGTKMKETAKDLGYIYQKNAPYEVYQTPWLTFEDMLELKRMEWVIGRYKNGGEFEQCIGYLIERGFTAPSDFLTNFCSYLKDWGCFERPWAKRALYEPLYQFARLYLKEEDLKHFAFLLEMAYILHERAGRAPFLPGERRPLAKERVHRFLQNPQNIKKFLPHYDQKPVSQILKNVEFHLFEEEGKKIYLFDFPYGTIQEITERF